MDRYQRVEKPRTEQPINENEIRITAQGLIRNYISYATSLLQDKRCGEIVLKAMGQAISKTVSIAEIIKKRIPGLHQDVSISSTSITDVWEPIEEGLEPLEMTRQVSLIAITLSMTELNKNSPGYQAPSITRQPKLDDQYQQRQQQPRHTHAPTADVNEDAYGQGQGWGRGMGRGRGRGRGQGWGRGRGLGWVRGRGGYGNNQSFGLEENEGYHQGGGRGSGWGYRGTGYERGRGSGRGGRGRMGGRGRGDGYQA